MKPVAGIVRSLAACVLVLGVLASGTALAVKPESDADLARDLRILVRDRLKAGDSDGQVIDYVVSRYGEFVLLKPRFEWRNALLWGAPVLLLVVGGAFMVRAARRRKAPETAALSDEEKARLDAILKQD